MRNISFNDIRNGMNVCDVNGDKIGTVKNVEQFGTVGGGYGTMGGGGYVQCDTGFVGLGKDLFIPLDSFSRCTGDTCYLNISKHDVNSMGWDHKPSGLR